jgi:ABC-type transport system involved in cytochrome c biogenesis permease subunit
MDVLRYADDRWAFITMLMLLVPAALYILGLMEGKGGFRFFLAGIAAHVAGIVQRGIEIGTVPLTEKHDNISFMALVMALSYLWLYRRKAVKGLELTLLPLIAILLSVAALHRTINTVSPFMGTPWFYLHTLFYFASYALLGVAACVGVHYVISGRGELERLQYRWSLVGWVLLCASLVVGGVWFYLAYGTYWLWTSKELWITLTWFLLGLYFHARMMNWLRGRAASVLGCLCFAAALFTYFGVGTVIPAPPTQF